MLGGAPLILGTDVYAASRIFNAHQARWHNRAYQMAITGVRPANVTGQAGVMSCRDVRTGHLT